MWKIIPVFLLLALCCAGCFTRPVENYRNLADFFTFFKTRNDFCKNTVEFPTEFSVFLNHTIFETMDFFKLHLSVFHMSNDVTSAGCSDIYC